MGLKQILPIRVRVKLEVIAMKGYSILPRYPELDPHHQKVLNVIYRTPFCEEGINPVHGIQSVYSKPHQQEQVSKMNGNCL